jgi:DNA-binding NarL/FixJ family response regulator
MRRVLIIRSNQLLASGVESLLLQKNNMIVKSAALDDEKSIWAEIRAFRPDVLILDESLVALDTPALLSLIQDFSNLRIVVVDIRANTLHIYDKRDVFVKQADDVIKVIQ